LGDGRWGLEEGLPGPDEILGHRWDQVVSRWPALQDQVEILRTEPRRSRSQIIGPWRVVAVREAGLAGSMQVVLAREYW
jgi:hypothetical protein